MGFSLPKVNFLVKALDTRIRASCVNNPLLASLSRVHNRRT